MIALAGLLWGDGILKDNEPYSLPCDGEHCPGKAFEDMPAWGTWSHNALDWALDRGILHGISSTRLRPKEICSRGQVLDYLYIAEGKKRYRQTDSPFSDVTKEDEYYEAVMWAIESSVAKGGSKSKFGVKKKCSREEVIAFLYAAAGKPEPEEEPAERPFLDVKADRWSYKAILWATEEHIITEDGSGRFGPDELCTREEAITFLYRVYGHH